MQKIWDVAPPLTWGILTAASAFLLAGFVLLSHALLQGKAHGDELAGLLGRGRLDWTLRLGVGCLLAGSALWAWELDAPVGWLAALGLAAAVPFGLELAARARTDA